MSRQLRSPIDANPFDLDDADSYAEWRQSKLAGFPDGPATLLVAVADPKNPTKSELKKIKQCVARCNMALFRTPPPADEAQARDWLQVLGGHLGLHRLDQNPYADEDSITPLHVAAGEAALEKGRKLYIPYTDKGINWHTDGYYNEPHRRICGMGLYCVRPAKSGGANQLFDPEMAYLKMRDADPDMVRALMHPQAMTIPGNDMDDDVERGDTSGPVFEQLSGGELYMRYTARKRNIIWRDDPDTHRAVTFLQELFETDGAHVFRHRMSAGEGLLCNNVLHTRDGFQDGEDEGQKRLVLRARYLDRIDIE